MQSAIHTYEVRPRKDHRGIDLFSDVLPFARLWYDRPDNAIGYAMHNSRSHHAVIRVYDDAVNVIETRQHKGNNLPDGAAPGGFQASVRQMLPTFVTSIFGINEAEFRNLISRNCPTLSGT